MTSLALHPVLEYRTPCEQGVLEQTPFLEWVQPNGTKWASFFRVENGYLIRFPNLADFTIGGDGGRVVAYPVTGTSAPTIDHLYLNQVLPLALSRQYKLVLHASAIEIDDFAVAFLGDSGMGKSTLAASFATSGHRFLTDDGLQLEKINDEFAVKPSHPSIRLWDDSREAVMPGNVRITPPIDYSPKSRLLADDEVAFCDEARPLRCMYLLGTGKVNGVMIEPVAGRDVMIELVRHSFLLDIEERDMLAHHFAELSGLAKKPIFFRLDYPRDYAILAAVREAVVRHASGLV